MVQEPDIDLRSDAVGPAQAGCLGAVLCTCGAVVGSVAMWRMAGERVSRADEVGLPLSAVMILLGVCFVFAAIHRLLDRSVKLSLTPSGLQDHRTGLFLRWSDCRCVRLEMKRRSSRGGVHLVSAKLYVKVWNTWGMWETPVDVFQLEREPEEITQLVEKRIPLRYWQLADRGQSPPPVS